MTTYLLCTFFFFVFFFFFNFFFLMRSLDKPLFNRYILHLIQTDFSFLYYSTRERSGDMFVIVVFLLQWSVGVYSQSIFSPPEFAEASCSGSNQWSTWFDSNNPSITLGEFEVTNHIQQIFSAFMCPEPIAIEVLIIFFYLSRYLFLLIKSILGSYNK